MLLQSFSFCSRVTFQIRGSAATSCHLYMSPVDQDAVACPHNETGIASPHARPPLTLLVHFGFADHPARPTASNAESASTPSPLNIAFDGREPVAFSKMPIACYPHAGETTAEFRDRIKLPPGVDFGRPGVKETLSFVLLDKVSIGWMFSVENRSSYRGDSEQHGMSCRVLHYHNNTPRRLRLHILSGRPYPMPATGRRRRCRSGGVVRAGL